MESPGKPGASMGRLVLAHVTHDHKIDPSLEAGMDLARSNRL